MQLLLFGRRKVKLIHAKTMVVEIIMRTSCYSTIPV